MSAPTPAPVTTTAEDAQEVAADLRKLIDSAPAHIWLDLGEGAAAPGDVTFRDLREVSWSEDNATGVGIKYVRAPVAIATSDASDADIHTETTFEIDAVIACLGEDAAAMRGENPDCEVAANMERAAQLLAGLPIDFKQATDQGGWQHVPEGCTPADARMLRSANHGLAAENDRLREALQFYADGNHFTMHDANAWDTVSGEPANFYEDEANTATVEDGSVAKMAMALQSEAAPTLLGVADGDAVGGKSGGARND